MISMKIAREDIHTYPNVFSQVTSKVHYLRQSMTNLKTALFPVEFHHAKESSLLEKRCVNVMRNWTLLLKIGFW